jgi:2-succinyl-6-hydroxy-2,4-cyclohexadiene-1-carboxylate synthase
VALAHEDRLRRSAAEHAAQLRGLGTGVMPPLWERLCELALPVTLVVGERDAKFRGIAERMARRLARGEIVVVEGAGHAVALEAPAAVAEAIDRTHPAVP